jgi:hypothetical protein
LVDHSADYILVNPISFPELHTLKFWIGEWEDVEPMVKHYFPLIESAPKLSAIHVEVDEETKEADIPFLGESSGWEGVDDQLCRLAEKASGPVTLLLEATSNPELTDRVSKILDGPQFLPKFREARGLIRLE